MFSGEIPIATDSSGRYFIDRSPKHFDRVLCYLRDAICDLPESAVERAQLKRFKGVTVGSKFVQECSSGSVTFSLPGRNRQNAFQVQNEVPE
ncbi:hypothetical protein WJX72_010456 [[Myrmecia] bisecta]|uniref:Potassium channel tetramerisation-type BTB domain-containing protein n=1 Tax=[Myrmecia] bisecta TaxID=41462 RepID=A0AAW1R9I5_9CHLO